MPAVRPSFHLTPCSKFRSHLFVSIVERPTKSLALVRKGLNGEGAAMAPSLSQDPVPDKIGYQE